MEITCADTPQQNSKVEKAQEELAKAQEEGKAELAALEASYIPQGPYKMKIYEIHARSPESFRIQLCLKLLENRREV